MKPLALSRITSGSNVKDTAYKVDLSTLLADCEMNYLRLSKLMPDELAEGSSLSIGVGTETLQLHIMERAPYTTMIDLSLNHARTQGWMETRLQVRMYHDAELAEVVESQGVRPIRPRYTYPNDAMFQQDEKAQLNRFLGEWLSQCLRCGEISAHSLTELVSQQSND